MILKKIRQWLYDNEKRDCYSIKIIINKNQTDLANLDKYLDVKSNIFPKPRTIKKLFEKEIKKIILDNKFYNAKIFVNFQCKIGTFKRKQLR